MLFALAISLAFVSAIFATFALAIVTTFAIATVLSLPLSSIFRKRYVQAVPVESLVLDDCEYDLKPLQGVLLMGPALTKMSYLLYHLSSLRRLARSANNMDCLSFVHFPDHPTFFPFHKSNDTVQKPALDIPQSVELYRQQGDGSGFKIPTSFDYYEAYRKNEITPTRMAQNLLKYVEELNPKIRAVVQIDKETLLREAEESTERWRAGRPLSLLDGVPITAKDQIQVKGMHTSKGVSFFDSQPSSEDATAIARLRRAGALIFAKVSMTELGMHTSGLNPHETSEHPARTALYGHCKNPYNPKAYTGGSSSGSGSAVAAGFGPISIGADGGGSIRIPSGTCGVYGIKPTAGRVSLYGDIACFGSVVDVVGPLSASPADLSLALHIISGNDEKDPATTFCPPAFSPLSSLDIKDLCGVRIGYYEPWFNDCCQEVREKCHQTLELFAKRGATIKKVVIPELFWMQVAHLTTIGCEFFHDNHHLLAEKPHIYSDSTRVLLGATGDASGLDYMQSAKMKTRAIKHFMRAFQDVDAIANPNTATAAPEMHPQVLAGYDELNVDLQGKFMRYMGPANLTGLPSCTFPVGFDSVTATPIAMQLMGRPWEEDLLLRIVAVTYADFERKKPGVFADVLTC
eukprot:TRINITY_DN6376_c0_g1_i1.p1 TRINITY_DN6376_c0_g1~~TRINITY_DN6376_c0_g1_i1.p1  ORF type:complete len:631 (-),score=165.57 TRINITY_DN6376_c0_g1_i1:47-1939(-)